MVDILYVHNSSLISGGERSLLQLWANLDRRVYTPHVVLPKEGVFAQEIRRMGIDLVFLDVPPLRPWTALRFILARRCLAQIVLAKNIRLIHSYTPRNNLLSSWVAHKAGIKVIWHERNLLWRGENDISRQFIAQADALICNSAAVAERFRSNGSVPPKVRVILNGIDLQRFLPAPNKAAVKERLGWGKKKVVGIVTNLEPRKGVETFLDVAAAIVRQRRDILFVVVGGCYGSGDRRMDVLRQRATALGLDGYLFWVGFQADVRPYVGGFDISLHVTEKEACSRAILESMAMRVPVMAFADGGNAELINDGINGILVPAGRVDILIERLMPLLDRDVELSRLGQAARARVQSVFDVRRNAAQTQALYYELLSGCALPAQQG